MHTLFDYFLPDILHLEERNSQKCVWNWVSCRNLSVHLLHQSCHCTLFVNIVVTIFCSNLQKDLEDLGVLHLLYPLSFH